VDESVEDGVGGGAVSDVLVSVRLGEFCGDEGGTQAVAIFGEFNEIPPVLVRQGCRSEIVGDEQVGVGKAPEQFGVEDAGMSFAWGILLCSSHDKPSS